MADARSLAELRALLHLRLLPGLPDRRLRELLAGHGTASAVLRAPAAVLGEAAATARNSRAILGRVERGLQIIEHLGIAVLTESDAGYPAGLRELHDPPPVLFALGRLELLDRPALAIVGARRPTAYGREAAWALAAGMARAGIVVVSGMARGIDGVAHQAALEGGTIGVLGCGVDVVYPREHEKLFASMGADGLLLSEFAPGEPPLQYHFPRRNRLIAALARGVLVVEASGRSGALITVEHALDLNREVMAVPGPIGRETSVGTNALIRDGAAMVLGVDDILAALDMPTPIPVEAEGVSGGGGWEVGSEGVGSEGGKGASGPPATLTPVGAAVLARDGGGGAPPLGLEDEALGLWRALGSEPRHAELLAATAGLDPATVLVHLLQLELGGHARQLAGMRFVRVAPEWQIG